MTTKTDFGPQLSRNGDLRDNQAVFLNGDVSKSSKDSDSEPRFEGLRVRIEWGF
ncbi:hypothetical protein [Neobacillus sp. YIM B06451]|uniref:hypothetical protein n=1 Tax=Neobacillus sp. YIM B06451 TaxID=3070994 RepID=UPI00292F5DE8|nr:hypothetical protein [Neobacillus sp. YIM B06451]